ncbi:MAG: hypothetical protein OHK93_001314 [Ramalina farinacea]|uniref:SSCRP protein n=1 Tax=Ramalina farinacea TaxID=258253 RepID=A0AA43QRB1_9LECA|nr:hypothetical protein [Ramalina farinacea]
MRSFAIATAFALVATLANAAPSAPLEARQSTPNRPVDIGFVGAEGSYELTEPADGSTFIIDNPLSVSTIEIGPGGYGAGFVNLAGCVFYGADGSVTRVGDDQNVDVGPPQPQVSGVCYSFQG